MLHKDSAFYSYGTNMFILLLVLHFISNFPTSLGLMRMFMLQLWITYLFLRSISFVFNAETKSFLSSCGERVFWLSVIRTLHHLFQPITSKLDQFSSPLFSVPTWSPCWLASFPYLLNLGFTLCNARSIKRLINPLARTLTCWWKPQILPKLYILLAFEAAHFRKSSPKF